MNGKRVESQGTDRLMVFQTPTLFPWCTTKEKHRLRPAVGNRRKAGDVGAAVQNLLELIRASKALNNTIHMNYRAECGSG